MGQYFITTFIKGFAKVAPYLVFILAGYFIFIKLPFLFLKKSMDQQKKKLHEDDNKGLKVVEEKYSVEDYMAFKEKMKALDHKKPEAKKEEPKKEKPKTEQKKEAPKKPAPPKAPQAPTPEEVFQLRPNEILSASELKKRYFELLKQNHPDRVASMGQEFKNLAEKNTKEINKAYEVLKKKAS